MDIISIILGILKAIPIIDSWYQKLSAAYIADAIARMKSENLDAIRKAITNHDQRDLEAAVGNPHPGEVSGDAGSTIEPTEPPGA